MDIAHQLEKLEQLRSQGTLSDVEFQAAKNQVLSGQPQPPLKAGHGMVYGIEDKTWCTLMHVSQLLNSSGVGVLVPIVMWILGKEKSEMVRRHGARMMNWIISSFIYAIIAIILMFVVIGVPLFFGVILLSVIFPIIAAVKANRGEIWSYPLSIKFLAED